MGFEVVGVSSASSSPATIDLYSSVGMEFYSTKVANKLHEHYILLGSSSFLITVWEGESGLESLVRHAWSFKCIPVPMVVQKLSALKGNRRILLNLVETFIDILTHECRVLNVEMMGRSFPQLPNNEQQQEKETSIHRLEAVKPSIIIQMERELTIGMNEIFFLCKDSQFSIQKKPASIASEPKKRKVEFHVLAEEIISSEQEYLSHLQIVNQILKKPQESKKILFSSSFFSKPKTLSKEEMENCFINIPQIIQLHLEFVSKPIDDEKSFVCFLERIASEYALFFSKYQNAMYWLELLRKTHLDLSVNVHFADNLQLLQFFGRICKRLMHYLHWASSLGMNEAFTKLSASIRQMEQISMQAERKRKTECLKILFPQCSLGEFVASTSLSECRVLICTQNWVFQVKRMNLLQEQKEIPWSFVWLSKAKKENPRIEIGPIAIQESNVFFSQTAQKMMIFGGEVLKKIPLQESEALNFVNAWNDWKNKTILQKEFSLECSENIIFCSSLSAISDDENSSNANCNNKNILMSDCEKLHTFCHWNASSGKFETKMQLIREQKEFGQLEDRKSELTKCKDSPITFDAIQNAHEFLLNFFPGQRNSLNWEAICKWLAKCHSKEESFGNKLKSTISKLSSLSLNSTSKASRISTLENSQSFIIKPTSSSTFQHSHEDSLFNSFTCPKLHILMQAFDTFINELQTNPAAATSKNNSLSPSALLNGKTPLTQELATSCSFSVLIECLKITLKSAAPSQIHQELSKMKHKNIFSKYFASFVPSPERFKTAPMTE